MPADNEKGLRVERNPFKKHGQILKLQPRYPSRYGLIERRYLQLHHE